MLDPSFVISCDACASFSKCALDYDYIVSSADELSTKQYAGTWKGEQVYVISSMEPVPAGIPRRGPVFL